MSDNACAVPLPEPELSLYRHHCVALLRRYFCMSVEVGRLPAILGRECFRSRVRDYHVHSFENLILFVIDVERCLDRLQPFDKDVVARIVLQESTREETAKLLHCSLRTIDRRLPDALDLLTDMFLRKRMLDITERVPEDPVIRSLQARCQRRVPQRAPKLTANPGVPHPPGKRDSHCATTLVKPPFSANSPQPIAAQENIFLSDVAGLPPQKCYAEL